MEEKLDQLFHLKERGTTVRTEVLAGLTTFVTAAYVLAVNPSVMSAAGVDSGAVFTATALVCFLGMPLCYSIVEGISLGIISYVCINLLCGNHKKICPMMYVLAIVFVIKYVLI